MNTCIFTGRTTKDVTVSKTQSGLSCANFTLAVDSIERGERVAVFVPHSIYGDAADKFAAHVKKGTKINVLSRIQNNQYTDRDGREVKTFRFVAERWEFAESKSSEAQHQNAEPQQQYQQTPQYQQPTQYQQPVQQTAPQQNSGGVMPPRRPDFMDVSGMDEQLPFN